MKTQVVNDPFHNPFYNRFNDPCQQRLDDVQSHEYTLWLGERSRAMSLSIAVVNLKVSKRRNALRTSFSPPLVAVISPILFLTRLMDGGTSAMTGTSTLSRCCPLGKFN